MTKTIRSNETRVTVEGREYVINPKLLTVSVLHRRDRLGTPIWYPIDWHGKAGRRARLWASHRAQAK